MGMKRRDGSIQSANLPAFSKLAKNRIDRDFGIYRCMVSRIHFVDDPLNTTYGNKQVTYEALVLGGPREGQILQNVKAMSDYGGQYNYSEKIYRPISIRNFQNTPLSNLDGDIVFVGFLQGNTRAPVILGAGVQPQDINFIGATSSNGYIDQRQFNGIYQLINKNGEYLLQRKGGTIDPNSGVFVPDSEGNVSSINLQQEQIICQVGAGAITHTLDGAAETMTVTFQSGMTVTLNGQADSAQIKTSGGGEINIVAGKIAIGAGSTELLDQLSKALTKLATFFNSVDSSHTHLGNLGYPTAPPTQASGFSQIGSDLTAIQGMIDGIKGAL